MSDEERSNPGSISVACRGPDDVLIQIDGDEITMLSLSLDADQAAKLADDLDAASMSARLFAGQVKAVE